MHETPPLADPTFTVALALAAAVLTQALARHLRLPGIILLLAAGAALGPDGLDVVRPANLGSGLFALVSFSVAVILFEGGLSLDLGHLRAQRAVTVQLVLLGPVVTVAGAAFAARYLLGWTWQLSVLFGTLVIVTGPTVINPLMRRFRVRQDVRSVLEAEGVLTDAVGAIIAVVALQVALRPSTEEVARGALEIAERLGFGAAFGLVSGFALSLLLRPRWLIPPTLRNVVTLALVFLVYTGADVILPESGIAAVIAAGLVVGSTRTHEPEALAEFKEELTVMLIGLLFVLLTAQVRFAEVLDLGWAGLAVVAVLILLVRPAHAALGTLGSSLAPAERAFIGWMAPRGIVAAAIATLFADVLDQRSIDGGPALRALVFLVIGVTVVLAGATGGLAARWCGVQRPSVRGFVLLGAGPLARWLATALRRAGARDLVCLSWSDEECRRMRQAGVKCLAIEDLDDETLEGLGLDDREGAIAVSPDRALNVLFLDRVARRSDLRALAASVPEAHPRTAAVLRGLGADVLFGVPLEPGWADAGSDPGVALARWRATADLAKDWARETLPGVLRLARVRKGAASPFTSATRVEADDELFLALRPDREEEARGELRALGLEEVP
ncbi:MAG: cation:proton antiporter [Sandaracinaceae bacterium]